MTFDPLLLAIVAPLVVAAAILCGLPKRLSIALSYAGFGIPAVVALWCWAQFPADSAGEYAFRSDYSIGLDPLGMTLHLGLNGIALPLFVLAGVVGLAAGLYAIQSQAERLKVYLMLLLVMQGGLMGVFASINVFFLYFFHELALIPTFIMVGVWGGRDRNYAAMKMTIYLTAGAMLSLIGLVALYAMSGDAVGTFDLIELRAALAAEALSGVSQKTVFGLLMFGLGILVSLWPFHTWAPLGYGAAPSSAAMLHAGVLKKFGLYTLIQVAVPLLPEGAQDWSRVLALLALGNVIVVGIIAIAQRDLKQMLGYSSVMHMGYAFLGIASLSVLGTGGVVLFMVAHGLSVALLFLLATSIHQRTQTLDLTEMGGLARHAPVLAAFFVAGTMASIGLPGLANFWGELTIFVALWNYSAWMTAAAIAGVVISAIYGLRSAAAVFFGPPTEAMARVLAAKPVADLRWAEKVPALILLAALLFIGFWPKPLSDPVHRALPSVARDVATARVAGNP